MNGNKQKYLLIQFHESSNMFSEMVSDGRIRGFRSLMFSLFPFYLILQSVQTRMFHNFTYFESVYSSTDTRTHTTAPPYLPSIREVGRRQAHCAVRYQKWHIALSLQSTTCCCAAGECWCDHNQPTTTSRPATLPVFLRPYVSKSRVTTLTQLLREEVYVAYNMIL